MPKVAQKAQSTKSKTSKTGDAGVLSLQKKVRNAQEYDNKYRETDMPIAPTKRAYIRRKPPALRKPYTKKGEVSLSQSATRQQGMEGLVIDQSIVSLLQRIESLDAQLASMEPQVAAAPQKLSRPIKTQVETSQWVMGGFAVLLAGVMLMELYRVIVPIKNTPPAEHILAPVAASAPVQALVIVPVTGGVSNFSSIVSGTPSNTREQFVYASLDRFYATLMSADTTKLATYFPASVRNEGTYRTYFLSSNLSKFLDVIQDGKVSVSSITVSSGASNALFSVSYVLTYKGLTGTVYNENRQLSMRQNLDNFFVNSMMCVTTGCSKNPFFNVGRYQ